MAQVLIRGRISTVELAAGEETIVEDTDRVQELARFGYIRIVGSIAGTHHEPTPEPVLSAAERAVAAGEDPVVAEIEAAYPDDNEGEPPRSGAGSGKATWQRFLIAQGIDYPEDATRDDLIAAWDDRNR